VREWPCSDASPSSAGPADPIGIRRCRVGTSARSTAAGGHGREVVQPRLVTACRAARGLSDVLPGPRRCSAMCGGRAVAVPRASSAAGSVGCARWSSARACTVALLSGGAVRVADLWPGSAGRSAAGDQDGDDAPVRRLGHRPAVTYAGVQDLLQEPARVGETFLGRYLVTTTSGSTGSPAVVVYQADPAEPSAGGRERLKPRARVGRHRPPTSRLPGPSGPRQRHAGTRPVRATTRTLLRKAPASPAQVRRLSGSARRGADNVPDEVSDGQAQPARPSCCGSASDP